MEPIAALGLAANVAQFIGYVSKLISKTVEIAGSVNGADEHTLELESIYNSLSAFSSSLRTHQPGSIGTNNDSIRGIRQLVLAYIDISRSPALDSNIRNIERLAQECHELCRKLLDVAKGFRVEWTTWRPARSFFQALKTTWGSKKIKNLEESLARYQGVITLHFFPLLRYHFPGRC